MSHDVLYVLAIVVVALVFDFINGFHDSANSIATVVSTRVLSPGVAVLWAAAFNVAAVFVVGTAVARTIGAGLIEPAVVDPNLILGALIGAIAWNLITWYFGLPSSSSHALMGGLGGAAIAKAGFPALQLGGWVLPILFIFLSPLLGMILALILTVILSWLLQGPALSAAYASADVFVFPSTTETFGNSLLEAMGSGLPSLVAASGGVLEFAEHGANALLVEPDSVSAIAAGLGRLLHDPVLRRRLADGALRTAAARDWATVYDRLLDDYQAAVATRAETRAA
jgi:phosphate/sulfate permease